jgi:hypothetical protein
MHVPFMSEKPELHLQAEDDVDPAGLLEFVLHDLQPVCPVQS